MILTAALVATLLLIAVFYWGQKTNLRWAHQVATQLETLTEPEEVEYLWLGGVLGFQALYHRARRLNHRTLKFTLLMLPRHSPLYLPLAWWRHRGDRLLVTLNGVSVRSNPTVPESLRPFVRNLEIQESSCTLDLRLSRKQWTPVLQEVIPWLASCS